ncbi:porin [Paracoccus laeviglucosivorans]|uniref:Outer membrane protein OmpU n=1 Tax=Paracoccus laeviglucosivorans TaxID=1197861 RepID=A0A521DJP1_9RHOB|nr:porin [Paracoccus laeviglucosivorans]SMO71896.1 outer membrane protein OmpU [Paracoccus laeviglucosivorans]
MKKVLFATSALVMSAGFASAEVAVSGDGRMGMIYDGNDVQFSSRARVKFTLTGESDAGLSFGGAFRVDQENYSSNDYRSAARGTGGSVWVSGTYGKLSMGDVVGAAEAAIGDLYEVGYTDGSFAGDVEEISFLVGDGNNLDQGPTALYEYTVNNISLYASMTDGSDTDWFTTVGADTDGGLSDELAYSLAAKYEGSNFWAALSYSKHDEAKEIGLAAEATFNNFAIKGVYMDYEDAFDGDLNELEYTAGLAGSYQMDAILVKGFWRQDKYDLFGTAGSEKYDSFGIGADYDLGGGAVLAGGIVDTDYLDDTVVDMGVKFKF